MRRRKRKAANHPRIDRLRQKKRKRILLWFTITMSICFLVAGLFFSLYNDRFIIDRYTISGLVHVKREEVIGRIDRYFLDSSGYVPAQNYFALDPRKVEELLLQSFSFKFVSAQKRYPNELHITAEERVSATIYSDGSAYVYVSPDGVVVQKLRLVHDDEWISSGQRTTTVSEPSINLEDRAHEEKHFVPDIRAVQAEFGNMPILIWPHGGALRPGWVDQGVAWYKELALRKMPVYYIEIIDRFGDARIRLENHTHTILINLARETEEQFHALATVLEHEQLPKQIEYIDLRFDGIIYFK